MIEKKSPKDAKPVNKAKKLTFVIPKSVLELNLPRKMFFDWLILKPKIEVAAIEFLVRGSFTEFESSTLKSIQ